MRRVAHLSDLHFGTETPRVVRALADSVRAFAPHLCVVTGDLTQRAGNEQFQSATHFLAALDCPLLVVPGNHDIAPLYRPLARLLQPYARYRRHLQRDELDAAYRDPELVVVGLSSVRPLRWKEGNVSRRQLGWLVERAHDSPAALRVLATHHPLVEAETGLRRRHSRRCRALMGALERADVSVCLSGHLHRSFSGLAAPSLERQGSVLAVHASTATSTRLRGHANAYNRLTLSGASLQVEAVAYDGAAFRAQQVSAFARVEGRWVTQAGAAGVPPSEPARAR